jgi:hypothetical protein
MVVVQIKEGLSYHLDNTLKANLDSIMKKLRTKDRDYVLIIDGNERSGKSSIAQQIASYVYPEFGMAQLCMNGQEFIKAIQTAPKGATIIYDEAYGGLSSRGALSEINNLIVSLMTEMGQRNLFVIIVIPSFFMLDKYAAIWRSRALIHTYFKRGQRGSWICFNNAKKKLLYLRGKKDYNYNVVRSSFRGRFAGVYTVDEEEYRHKKDLALKNRDRSVKGERFRIQRDKFIKYIYNNLDMSLDDLQKLCKKIKVSLKKTQLSEIVKQDFEDGEDVQDNPPNPNKKGDKGTKTP